MKAIVNVAAKLGSEPSYYFGYAKNDKYSTEICFSDDHKIKYPIGINGRLICNISSINSMDMKIFRKVTITKVIRGNSIEPVPVVIMGRKTFESIGSKPLPDRCNIILTSDTGDSFVKEDPENIPFKLNPSVIKLNSVEEIIDFIDKNPNLSEESTTVIGGEKVYDAFAPYINKLYIAISWIENDPRFKDDVRNADTYFPICSYEKSGLWKSVGNTTPHHSIADLKMRSMVSDSHYNETYHLYLYNRCDTEEVNRFLNDKLGDLAVLGSEIERNN